MTTSNPTGAKNPFKFRCVADYVAPRVTVDYYSFSAWSAIYADDPNQNRDNANQSIANQTAANNLKSALSFALAKVQTMRPTITAANFIVGELGAFRTYPGYGECNTANRLKYLSVAAEEWGVSYAILWQIIDSRQAEFATTWIGDGLIKGNGTQALSAQMFQGFIAGTPPPDYSGCYFLTRTRGGNGADLGIQAQPSWSFTNFNIAANASGDDFLGVFGGNSWASGTVVHFNQNIRKYLLPQDNSALFGIYTPAQTQSSYWQINASMPTARRPGDTLIYLTDNNGYDYEGRVIPLTWKPGQEGPQIRTQNNEGVTNGVDYNNLHYYHPGTIMSIYPPSGVTNTFSPSGNQVKIEKDGMTYTVQAGSTAWYESASQINFELPPTIDPGRFRIYSYDDNPAGSRNGARVYVVNAQGVKSNEFIINMTPSNNRPYIREKFGVQNGINWSDTDFHPGTVISIFGSNFSPSGNKVVIEQGNSAPVVKTSGSLYWWEGVNSQGLSQINTQIPTTIQPGWVRIYTVDNQGVESNSRFIQVLP